MESSSSKTTLNVIRHYYIHVFRRKTSRVLSNYAWALPFLPNKPLTGEAVLDVGAYDLKDSIFLAEMLGCRVISFEADPSNFEKCFRTYQFLNAELQEKITIDNRFLGIETKLIDFYKINPDVYENTQASSKYKLDFSERLESDPDYGKTDVQDLIEVNSVRFEDTIYDTPHSIFMDVQGSELEALIGFGDKLLNVQNIVLETSFKNSYINSSDFINIDDYLRSVGFKYLRSSVHGTKKPQQNSIFRPLDFDVIYSKLK